MGKWQARYLAIYIYKKPSGRVGSRNVREQIQRHQVKLQPVEYKQMRHRQALRIAKDEFCCGLLTLRVSRRSGRLASMF